MKRRNLLIALGAGLAMPLASLAQQQGKIRRIGFLFGRSRPTPQLPDPYLDAFVQGMRELGYVEGKNLVIEWRFADDDYKRLPGLAAELVALNVEVIVTHFSAAALAVNRATATIPIVSTALGNAVAQGFVASLARPGGNLTGLSLMAADIVPKQIELLKRIAPKIARIAVLHNPGNPNTPENLKLRHSAARQLGMTIVEVKVRTPVEIEQGFAEMARARVDSVIVNADSFIFGQRHLVVALLRKHRLPSLSYYREDVQAGVLMSYGQNIADFYRRGAVYVDKILKGAKPGDLPIEQPAKIHVAINLRTAKALGLVVPKELVFQADEVFE